MQTYTQTDRQRDTQLFSNTRRNHWFSKRRRSFSRCRASFFTATAHKQTLSQQWKYCVQCDILTDWNLNSLQLCQAYVKCILHELRRVNLNSCITGTSRLILTCRQLTDDSLHKWHFKKVKVKVNVDVYSALSWSHLYSTQVWHAFSRDLTVLPAHPAFIR